MNWGDIIAGLALAVPSFLLGYLAYRRSVKVDAVSEQSGVLTEARAGTTQIIEGLNKLIDQLQEDNKDFRADISLLTARLDVVIKERDDLKLDLVRMRRKYGNGDNGP